jgi:hypothetical protein
MIPLLIWLAGCAFGIYAIIHYGFYREAAALAVCGSVLLWIVGGASWIGKRLHTPSVPRGTAKGDDPFLDAINRDPQVVAAKKRIEELRSNVK